MPGWHISRGIYSINLKLHFLSLQTRQRKSPVRFAQSEEKIHICIISFYYPSVKVRMQETEERNKVVLATKSFFYWNCEILDVLTVYWMFHKTKIQFVFMAFSFYETAGSCFLSTYLLVKSQVFFFTLSLSLLKKIFPCFTRDRFAYCFRDEKHAQMISLVMLYFTRAERPLCGWPADVWLTIIAGCIWTHNIIYNYINEQTASYVVILLSSLW